MKLAFLRRIFRDQRGSAAIEFALIGPTMIAMMLAVLQIGMGMKCYNAMRGASGDIARYAMVNYQSANKLSDNQLTTYARSVATGQLYRLDDGRLEVEIATPETQRVNGASEKTITMRYAVPTVLSIVGLPEVTVRFERPIFLLN